MNCVGKFILSIVVVFCMSSNLCHVFGLNIEDDVSGGFRITNSRWFPRKLSLCPVKHLFGGIAGYGIVNGDWHKFELSSVCWTGSIRVSTVEVFNSILGIRNV